MNSWEEINKLVQNPQKENLKVELKRFQFLRDTANISEIGYEIIAFANRFGGKLIFGINDNGNFEGKYNFDLNKDKQIIDNICHNNISPPIDYDTELLSSSSNDLLIVDINKRKNIPHAYIVSRNGPEIKNRIYYIRTPHGKRLVNDTTLGWLFCHNEDPNFNYGFPLIIHYFSKDLKIPYLPHCGQTHSGFIGFVNSINGADLSILQKEDSNFFLELTPYILLCDFFTYFYGSWLIEVKRSLSMYSYSSKNIEVGKEIINVDDIPMPFNNSILGKLTWDFKELFSKQCMMKKFFAPPNTKIIIDINDSNNKKLIINNPDFNFNFNFGYSCLGKGTHYNYPITSIIDDQDRENISFAEIRCDFTANFNFPDTNPKLFNHYIEYAKTIKDILYNQWDSSRVLESLPSHEIVYIKDKVDLIYKKLYEKSIET